MDNLIQALNPTEADYLQQLLLNPIKRLTLHSDVELTESEIAEALISAKSEKSKRLIYEKNEQNRRNKSNLLLQPFNSEQLVSFCQDFYFTRFDKQFVIDERNDRIVQLLSMYFTNDPEFERGGYSLKKGILLMGNVGTGKTELMRFFQKNKKSCFEIKNCKAIAADYTVFKGEIEDVYSTPKEKPLHDPNVFFQKYIGMCFDDLGTEEIKNDYGNKKNVMADVLSAVYEKKDYTKFHMTTNLSNKEEIIERYGTRVNSRLREMFNVFEISGSDRRK